MTRIEEIRASGGCTCGSGAHPRDCVQHPERYEEHVREIEEDAEMDRRAEVALMGEPAGAEGEGRLTHWSGSGCGALGLSVAGTDSVEEAPTPKVAISHKPDYQSKNGPVVENLTGSQSV